MRKLYLAIMALLGASITPHLYAESTPPPSFQTRSGTAVFADFERVHIDYNFNYRERKSTGQATITFKTFEDGFPVFDLVPNITSLSLDGEQLPTSLVSLETDPDNVSRFRVLRKQVSSGDSHTLEVGFTLDNNDITYQNNMVRVGFFMSDLNESGRGYFEQYGPANFEFDQYQTTMRVRVTGTSSRHVIFSNGALTEKSLNDFELTFPSYFTASSLYFHMAKKGYFNEMRDVFEFNGRRIPLIVYSTSASRNSTAMRTIKKVMRENSETYGDYAHDVAVAYMTSSGGGMEYCGATISSQRALEHEFTHFWFARGLMPANGNTGWIDEAIASWRDNGYPRANRAPNRSPVNMGGFSAYRRHTSRLAYTKGATLMSEFDYIFRNQGGLKPALKSLFEIYANKTFTLDNFINHIEDYGNDDFTDIFDRYVKGRTELNTNPILFSETHFEIKSNHPRPFTKKELALLR